jgi:hypothetical protein
MGEYQVIPLNLDVFQLEMTNDPDHRSRNKRIEEVDMKTAEEWMDSWYSNDSWFIYELVRKICSERDAIIDQLIMENNKLREKAENSWGVGYETGCNETVEL